MNFSVIRTCQLKIGTKDTFVLLTVLGCLVASQQKATAEIISESSHNLTTVDVVGDRIDISGGHLSSDNVNIFHNFEQFDITSEQTANFLTAAGTENIVGNINSVQASTIDGTLQVSGSNANLYLMNSAGILFGPNAQLNLSGGFTATTATDIGFEQSQLNSAISHGDYSQLTGEPKTFHFESEHPAAVVNLGELNVEPQQSVTLLGGTVVNAGELSAPAGTITVAAVEGESVVRISQGEQLLSLEVAANSVSSYRDNTPEYITSYNTGAQSIGEMLTGGTIDHANALTVSANGSVSLSNNNETIDESGGHAIIGGILSTVGSETNNTGGNINVLGNYVELSNAALEAFGETGGGLIRVGGDYQGQGEIFTAVQTIVDADSSFDVSARERGNGGVAIAWADHSTQFYGRAIGTGGVHEGDGGFVEVSGKEHLIFDGFVDLSATQGSIGTLLLDPENIFITNAGSQQTIGNDDYIPSTTLETQMANIALMASNNIVIEDLLDNELLLSQGGFANFTADSDNSGTGAFIMQDLNDVIRGEQKDISISGAGISVGTIDTSTAEHDSGGTSGVRGGHVTLNSREAVSAEQISTYGELFTPNHHSGDGGNVHITAQNGNIEIKQSLLTYSEVIVTGGREAGSAGDIILHADNGNIRVGDSAPAGSTVLQANSRTAEEETGYGGNIELIARNGEVEIAGNINTSSIAGSYDARDAGDVFIEAGHSINTGDILAQSSAKNGDDAGLGGDVTIVANHSDVSISQINTSSSAFWDNASDGGDVEIRRANNVGIGSINTSSSAEDDASEGGDVLIEASGLLSIAGTVNTSSSALDEGALSGGNITLSADRLMVNRLDTRSQDTDDDADIAGTVSLTGNRLVEAGSILATSTINSNADIFITSDQIALVGGANSVVGKEVQLTPFSSSRDINIGTTRATNALNLQATDIAAIDSSVRNIRIGLTTGTGEIAVDQSAIASAGNRPSIRISGGESLIGPTPADPSVETVFLLEGPGFGGIENADIRFTNIQNLFGGDGKDSFRPIAGTHPNDFVSLVGGDGVDSLSYEALTTRTTIDLSTLDIRDVETIIGPSLGATLIGTNQVTQWTINDVSGTDVVSVNGIQFENIDELIGGDLEDTFEIVDSATFRGSISGGGGYDQLDYDRYLSSIDIDLSTQTAPGLSGTYADIEKIIGSRSDNDSLQGTSGDEIIQMVDATNGSIQELIAFTAFEKISGAGGSDTLISSDTMANSWTIDGLNSGSLNGSSFFDLENLAGGTQIDTFNFVNAGIIEGTLTDAGGTGLLDYRAYNNAISVDFSTQMASGVSGGVTGITAIVGRALAGDTIIGTIGDDVFSIVGDRTGSLNDSIAFSNIETLNGGAGTNTFNLENLTADSGVEIVGGSDLDNSLSNNRILTNSSDALWQISSKNAGTLRQGANPSDSQSSNQLASFREIQHLEQTSNLNETTTALFTTPIAQVTGSIDSGNNNLILMGNDINIGHGNGTGDNQNGLITGSGQLTIMPELNSVDIELGGIDSGQANTLNITAGELASIQAGFDLITIGGAELTGNIRTLGDIAFHDSVTLRSQGSFDTTAGEISTTVGDLSLLSEAGSITTGIVSSRAAGIDISARDDVTIETANASGGNGLSINSDHGNVTVNNGIETQGSNVSIAAKTDISVQGDINTAGSAQSGQASLNAESGHISAEGIITATGTGVNDVPGNVTLSSLGSIEIEFIDATDSSNTTSSTTIEPLIRIDTRDSFRATGSIPGKPASISTAGASDGGIEIIYGETEQVATNFAIATAESVVTNNSTAAAGSTSDNLSEGNITFTNRGIQPLPPEPPLAEQPNQPAEQLTSNVLIDVYSVEEPVNIQTEDQDDLFTRLETRIGKEFGQYLSLTQETTGESNTLISAQEQLEEIEQNTRTKPALLYVFFTPDAGSEAAVDSSIDYLPSPEDQLEVMLIAKEGEPILHRQWGITRSQVESTGEQLRQQAVSQVSSTRQHLAPAQQLYDWIMKPIANELERQEIDSLGFVLDTGLRTIPLAAMHNGSQYLVENYSVGLLPSFSLTDFTSGNVRQSGFDHSSVLAMGASEFDQQANLPAVDAEIRLITEELWQGEAFLNEDFVLENLQSELQSQQHDVVHLATHANFVSGDLENSYIQLWNEQLSLSNMDDLQLSEAEIRLMILSACNTAFGDEASEYGFAGLAINSGTPSVMASLWPVSDEGTLGFMSQFYTELSDASVKAEALRAAQINMINGDVRIDDGTVYGPSEEAITHLPTLAESGRWDFSHPFYWAAFTMIGSPW